MRAKNSRCFFSLKIKQLLIVVFAFVNIQSSFSQVIINEISGSGQIEFKNVGTVPVDISNYWVYSFPNLRSIANEMIICDTTFLEAGAILAIDSFPLNGTDGELALFNTNSFGSTDFIIDYVEWGSHGHFNGRLAKGRGIWENGDFVFPFTVNESIEYIGSGQTSHSWEKTTNPSICSENSIGDDGCLAEGGDIVTSDNLNLCIDGSASLINAVRGSVLGETLWIVTDENNFILENDAQMPYDFAQFGPGICFLRSISFTGSITGNEVGNNLNAIVGCFSFSNILQVNREIPNGGLVITAEGAVNVDVCKDKIEIPMNHLTTNQNLDYWYVVTSLNSAVIAAQNSAVDSVITLEDMGLDQCRIYGVSGANLGSPVIGASLSSYLSFGCKAVSSNSILVNKLVNDSQGGIITTQDELIFCNQDNIPPINVERDTSAQGNTIAWVITNGSDTIIQLPDASPFAFDTFGVSESKIYSISYQIGASGIEIGNSLDDIIGCFSLSNAIEVSIQAPEGGMVETIEGDDLRTFCSGNVRVQMTAVDAATRLSYYYLVTSDLDVILEIIPSSGSETLVDLSSAPEGLCRIYGWSQSGILNPQVGQSISQLPSGGCSDLSDNFVSIIKLFNPNIGGQIATNSATNICIDNEADLISVFLNGSFGDSSRWVITNEENMILSKDMTPPFDLNGAGIGTCTIYHMSFGSDLNGLNVGNNLFDLENCYSLSNPITVNRDTLNAGQLKGRDTTLQLAACKGGVYTRITHSGNSSLLDYSYVIGSSTGAIVELLDPEDGPVYDLSHLNVGKYRIYGWAHDGFEDALVNNPLMSLTDGPCQALTDTFLIIDILPNPHEGGILSTESSTTICIDSNTDFIDLDLVANEGVVKIAFMITDENFNIIEIPDSDPPFNLDDGVPGVFLLWNVAHNGAISGFEEGNNIADIVGCFSLSNSIRIEKVLPDGGEVFGINGESELQFCSGTINFSAAFVTTTPNLKYNYVVTDESGLISQVSNAKLSSSLTLNNVSEGTCRVYGWAFDGDPGDVLGMSILELEDFECSSVSSNFINIIKLGNANNGGVLTASSLQVNCSDGIPDPIEVDLIGAFGSEQSWIITDASQNILALPFAPPFNLDPVGGGTYFIYSISYETGLSGLTVFNSLNDLQGCYDLSNGLQVINQEAQGGIISSNDDLTVCAGSSDSSIDLVVIGEQGQNFTWLLTDLVGNILELSATPSFDFVNAQAGACLVWHLAFVDILGLELGRNISGFDGCYDLSNSLMINKLVASAGQISLSNGTTETSVCINNNNIVVNHPAANTGFEYKLIVTDQVDNVIQVSTSSNGALSINSSSVGLFRIYGWTVPIGTADPALGSNVIDLNTGCSDLSNNFISINQVEANGASVVSTEGPSTTICIDGVSDPIRMFNTASGGGLIYTYLVTDLNGNVLMVVNGDFVDLDQAGVGVCLVYGYNHDASSLPNVGDNINVLNASACGSISTNSISITRQAPNGGVLLSDGGDVVMVCIDQESDPVLFTPNTSSSSLPYSYVITDEGNNIIEVSEDRLVDFNTRPVGVCRVYGWSHNNNYTPQTGDDLASLENIACGDLTSNFITIIKADSGDICIVSTEDLASHGYSLFPNPSSGKVYIKGDGHLNLESIDVYNLNGQLLKTERVVFTNGLIELELNGLSNGAYIIQLRSDEYLIHAKVLIAK